MSIVNANTHSIANTNAHSTAKDATSDFALRIAQAKKHIAEGEAQLEQKNLEIRQFELIAKSYLVNSNRLKMNAIREAKTRHETSKQELRHQYNIRLQELEMQYMKSKESAENQYRECERKVHDHAAQLNSERDELERSLKC